MKKGNIKYRSIASFAKNTVWKENIKPELERMKVDLSSTETLKETIEEAAIRDIKRSTTNNVINKIIRFVERAESKIK